MINLNDVQYSESNEIVRNLILSKYSEEEIFRHYLPEFTINKPFSSPFRTDNNPSFAVFIGRDTGKILYHEMLYREVGNCFMLVKNMFNLSYTEALLKICYDLNISNNFIEAHKIQHNHIKQITYTPKNLQIGVKHRKWNNDDKIFWSSFNISKAVLLEYKVNPISFIFYNNTPVKADKLAYCFQEYKDNKLTFKIYQPYNKKFKWSNNHDSSVWQGWKQLDDKADILIITSSLKDLMSIKNTCNINAIALQAETTKPKPHIIDELKSRFKTIYVFYDNDYEKEQNWGQLYANELCTNFNLKNIVIPSYFETKDFSDMIKKHSIETSKQWLLSTLQKKQ